MYDHWISETFASHTKNSKIYCHLYLQTHDVFHNTNGPDHTPDVTLS